jgi:hypothetical protein
VQKTLVSSPQPPDDEADGGGSNGPRGAVRVGTMAASALRDRVPDRLREGVVRRFGVDPRALAAMRMAVGLVVLLDLLLRSRSLVAFYTDAGVLPRSALAARYPLLSRLSLHAWSGGVTWQVVLFVALGLAATALVVGYRTKLATALTFLLVVSLHLRNPLVLNGGDVLLRRLLFWGLLLPLGGRWSLDGVAGRTGGESGDGTDRRLVASVATAGLLVQVVLVYAANLAIKLQGQAWPSGRALHYVFELDQYTVLLGNLVGEFPLVVEAIHWAWMALLAASVLLVVTTGWPRLALAGSFVAMHLGMVTMIAIGIFPLVSVAALLAFLPPFVWDAVEATLARPLAERLAPARRQFARRIPTPSDAAGRPTAGRIRAGIGRIAPAVAALALAFVLVWNAVGVGLVAAPTTGNEQVSPDRFSWNMFAPSPPGADGWYVAPATTESGERVDAYGGGAVTWERPPELASTYRSARWRKSLEDLRWEGDEPPPTHADFAGYLCHRWNRTHDDDLTNVSVYYVRQQVNLEGQEPRERVELADVRCSAVTAPVAQPPRR